MKVKFKGVKEYDVVRTVEEHNEHIKKLTKESEGKVKMTILIEVKDDQILQLNNVMNELHRQIDVFGFKTGFKEEWGVKIGDEQIAGASFNHPNEVEIVWGREGTDIVSKAKSKDHVYLNISVFPNKDYIKYLMA